jgi:hypothetical protein
MGITFAAELALFPAAGTKLTPLVAVPFPVSLSICGLLLALSVMLIVPVRLPVIDGVKVTFISQLDSGATAPPQVLFWA